MNLITRILLCAILASLSIAGDTSTSPGVSRQERQALIALYQSTDGSHWKNHDGWLGPEGTECNWQGVECPRWNQEASKSSNQSDVHRWLMAES